MTRLKLYNYGDLTLEVPKLVTLSYYCALSNNHNKQNFLDNYYLIICVNDSMTLELKQNSVLIYDLQYIYKHKHLFITDIWHTTGHIIMHMVH